MTGRQAARQATGQQVAALYRLFVRTQATRGRLAALGALAVVGLLLGLAIGRSNPTRGHLAAGADLIDLFGLSLLVPLATLVFASAALGDPVEDRTLAYLWARPVPRLAIAGCAAAAALTIVMPVVLLPLVLTAALVGAGSALVAGAAAAALVGAVAYAGLFTYLGARLPRPLLWGLGYVVLWEGVVAGVAGTAARFSIRAHTQSLLTHLADGPSRFDQVSLPVAVAVPLVVGAAAVWLTARRLRRIDVP